MEYKLTNTGDYLLIVDDSEIKEACYVYKNHEQEIGRGIFYIPNDIDFKAFNAEKSNIYIIKAHLPLNNSPILEGVDLLPPIEDEVEKLAQNIHYDMAQQGLDANGCFNQYQGFIKGYNKAKEKYKYTEEDMKKAINLAYVSGGGGDTYQECEEFVSEQLESLQQPKLPVGFKYEMEKERGVEVEVTDKMGETRKVTIPYNGSVYVFNDFKTITNSQGLTQWVGEYIYD